METLAYSQIALSYEEAQEGYEEVIELPAVSVKTWWKRGQCCALALGTVAVGLVGTTTNALALLKQGDRGAEVTRVQQRLQRLDYFEEQPTGYFGDITENALKRFQRDRGLKPDGILGPNTEAALFGESQPNSDSPFNNSGFSQADSDSPFNNSGFLSGDRESSAPVATAEPQATATAEVEVDSQATARLLKLRDKGDRVRQLQIRLEKAGFSPGEADGIFGEQTREAVLGFQRSRGLTVDGIAGRETLSALATEVSDSNTESQRLYTVTVKSS